MRMRTTVLGLAVALPLALGACGGGDETAADPSGAPAGQQSPAATEDAGPIATLEKDGPAVCFDLITEHLGGDAMVNEIDSDFSVGKEVEADVINPDDTAPAGELKYCEVRYQNPDDPKKLLSSSLDMTTGEFGGPDPVEITVSGDASTFDLNDYVMKLSDINTDVQAAMDAQRGRLDKRFGTWAWSGVDLTAPGAFGPEFWVRVDAKGRLASNDIVDTGYMELSPATGKVANDHLD